MPRAVVLLPTTTYRAADFVAAADSLGVDLVVASDRPPPFDMGDRYVQVDCSDPEAAARAIVQLGDSLPIDGLVAADDSGVVPVSLAAEEMGLPGNDPAAAAATRDKLEARLRMAEAEVPQPAFAPIPAGEDGAEAAASLGFPLVVKPVSLSAGQGVIRVDGPDELSAAVARSRSVAGPGEPLVAEEYMRGGEVALEGVLRDGALATLALFDKPDPPEGPYFPETILVTPSRLHPTAIAECERVAAAAVSAIGLEHGPVHVEMRVEEGIARVIEVAARSIGGLCSRSLGFGLTGTSLEAVILRNALGMDKPELRRGPGASGALMIPIPASGELLSVEGLGEAKALAGVTGVEITVPRGARLEAPPDGDRYLGFVFASGDDPASVESTLRKANDAIRVLLR